MTDSMFGAVAGVWLLTIVGGLVGCVAAGWYTWLNAPMVGAEMWPYIHVGATVLAGFLGLKVGAFIGFAISSILGAIGVALSAMVT